MFFFSVPSASAKDIGNGPRGQLKRNFKSIERFYEIIAIFENKSAVAVSVIVVSLVLHVVTLLMFLNVLSSCSFLLDQRTTLWN